MAALPADVDPEEEWAVRKFRGESVRSSGDQPAFEEASQTPRKSLGIFSG